LGDRALRRQAGLALLAPPLHDRLPARGRGLVDRLLDRLSHPAGPRRGADPSRRPDDPRAGRRATADGARDEPLRRADAARPVLGPGLGGLIVDRWSGRGIFFINLPVGVAAVLVAQRLLPEAKPQLGQRLDLGGLALLSPGIAWPASSAAGRGEWA